MILIVENGVCVRVELNTGLLLESNTLQYEEYSNELSSGRVVQMARYVILTEDELLFRENGQFPLCGQHYH